MDTNITRYDHTTATDYMYGNTTQEYMALMESSFMWVYPEPIYGDTGSIVGSEWYAVHAFSNDLVQVSNLFQDICIGADKEEYNSTPCPDCFATGKTYSNHECSTCGGNGFLY